MELETKIVLSYHDSLIRMSDFNLLDPPHWINDKLIGFYFEYMERCVFDEFKDALIFITPDVTQFIKLSDGPELGIFLDPLGLREKKLVVLAINDCTSSTAAGGSHWSTLVYDRELNMFWHMDSYSPMNRKAAQQCAEKIRPFVQGSGFAAVTDAPMVEMDCPQQHNCFDCGVYAALFSEFYVKSRLMDDMQLPQFELLTLGSVAKWRTDTKDLILKLAGSIA